MANTKVYDMNGIIFYEDSMYNDWDGNEVERKRHDWPYSYDAYVIFKKRQEYQHTSYSDRLFQQDHVKYNKLTQKHFNNNSQYWNDKTPEQIEAFLRDFFNKPDLELIGIMEGCNVSNGYPYWIFMYNCEF